MFEDAGAPAGVGRDPEVAALLGNEGAGGGDEVRVVTLLRPERRTRARHRRRIEDDDVIARTPVLLGLSAEVQGDEVRARIQTVDALDRAAAKVQKGLRIFVRDEAPLDAVAKRLDMGYGRGEGGGAAGAQGGAHGEGEVNLVVMLNAGAEVEVKLPGRYKVSPQIAGAIKAVPGVVEVLAV